MDSEKNIEELLKKLSADKKPYPKELLKNSRAAYLSQVSSVISSGPQLHKGNGQGQGGSPTTSVPMTPLMKVILTALVAANIALATYLAVTAYENWDKIQDLLLGASPVSETLPAPVEDLNQAPESVSTPEITISPEGVVTPNATPVPTNPSDGPQPSGGDNGDNPQVSTPEPGGKDNPGKHLGQTPHTPDDPPGQDDQDKNDKDKNKNK